MANLVVGFLAGVPIALLMILASHSEIAFGNYSLTGNGAFAVPQLLVPFALFGLWTWVVRTGRGWRDMLVTAVGLHLGFGTATFFDAFAGFAISPLSFLLNGVIFVAPVALVTALVYWLFTSERVPPTPMSVALATIVALGFATLFPLAPLICGLLAGPAIYTASKAEDRSSLLPVTIALAGLLFIANVGVPILIYNR